MEKRWLGEDGKKLIAKTIEHFFASKKLFTSSFHFDFMEAILDYFTEREVGVSVEEIAKGLQRSTLYGSTPASRDFFYNILPEISGFARTDAETDALVMMVFDEVLKTISQPIYAAVERRGLMSPHIDMRGMS